MTLLRHLPRFRKARRSLDRLAERERWTRDAIEAWQLRRLNQVWSGAVRRVPHYRELAGRLDLPARFTSLSEFREAVPVLEKGDVRARPDRFRAAGDRGPGCWKRTGGSTGTPMRVYWDREAHREMLRCQYRQLQMHGVDIFDRQVHLWGHGDSFAPGWRGRLARLRRPAEDALRNRLRLSAYRLGAGDLARYVQRIRRFDPVSLYGYSTAVELLAIEARRRGAVPDRLRLVILTGEPVFPRMRSRIESGLGAPVAVEYGSVECGLIAFEHDDGTLRVREDVTMVETLLREDGRYDVVVTVLNNPAFPLLRYRIEDVADSALRSPRTGFSILGHISGRDNDMLVTGTGRRVHPIAVKHVFEQHDFVRRFRAHQESSGRVRVLVEARESPAGFVADAVERLRRLLEGRPVEIDLVGELPASSAGKHRFVVSELRDPPIGEADAVGRPGTAGTA